MYDDELVERVARAIYAGWSPDWEAMHDFEGFKAVWRAKAVAGLDAVSGYLAEQGPDIEGDWWTEGPREGEA